MEKKFSKIEGPFSQCYYVIKISVLGIILKSFLFCNKYLLYLSTENSVNRSLKTRSL